MRRWLIVLVLLVPFLAPVPSSALNFHPCHGATIEGTRFSDFLVGTGGRDVIRGREGNDTILGLGGGDVICGNAGNDTILGQDGSDFGYGAGGADRCNTEHSRSC